jgi:hypothetical protein
MTVYIRGWAVIVMVLAVVIFVASTTVFCDEEDTRNILKQGLVGAGAGALAAGASGGDAGKGALIGAGTNVIGNALLDTITQPAEQRRGKVYRRVPRRKPATTTQEENISGDAGTRKKIIRKYDESGKVVSEEEVYY